MSVPLAALLGSERFGRVKSAVNRFSFVDAADEVEAHFSERFGTP